MNSLPEAPLKLKDQTTMKETMKANLVTPVPTRTLPPALPRWIPVSEGFPSEDQTVIVLCDDGALLTAWPSYWHGASTGFACWSFPHGDDADSVVTHWMPLRLQPPALPEDAIPQRAKEIRAAIFRNDTENEALWKEYCQIFPAGVIDGEDIAWATAHATAAPSKARLTQANAMRLMTFAQHGQPKEYAASDMMRADLEALILAALKEGSK